MRRLLIGTVTAVLALSAAGGGSAATSFADPAGDAETAPDIVAVSVGNDAAGRITFAIALADGTVLAADSELALGLDSDRDESTGDGGGFDHLLELRGGDRSWHTGRALAGGGRVACRATAAGRRSVRSGVSAAACPGASC
jgi:hypothetical protein